MTTYIIEHCDPELYEWSLIEYEHVSTAVGKEHLLITNTDSSELNPFARTDSTSVTNMNLHAACLLDPHAPETLTPSIAKQYTHFIFGGILGNDPPSKKTQHFLTSKDKWPAYNLGPEQMPTDNAIMTVKQILDGKRLEELTFASSLEIVTGDNESVTLPFKYLIIEGKPFISEKIIELLQEEHTF